MDAYRRKGNRIINLYRHPGPVHCHQDSTEVKGWLFFVFVIVSCSSFIIKLYFFLLLEVKYPL